MIDIFFDKIGNYSRLSEEAKAAWEQIRHCRFLYQLYGIALDHRKGAA